MVRTPPRRRAGAILTYRAAGEAIAFDCRAPMRHIPPMRLGYFTMPLHPPRRDPAQTLQEDREAIVLADRLGFHDAFVGEHLTDRCENVTNGLIFLATLIGETKRIKLATGTSNLSQSHPVVIAAQAAMFDHLAKGRFIFGISPGPLSSDAEALGILVEEPIPLLLEAAARKDDARQASRHLQAARGRRRRRGDPRAPARRAGSLRNGQQGR